MVSASKILTVSYGTFSCTLEGFDDPFSTMRSIAEYFRDLAADDRYFGAEPPTPDAEMLHRIAEREINRRVEARVQDNGVVLRQLGVDHEAEPPQAAADALKTDTAADTGATRLDETRDVEAQPMDAARGESVAEKLRRIRAAVARVHDEPQVDGLFADAPRPEGFADSPVSAPAGIPGFAAEPASVDETPAVDEPAPQMSVPDNDDAGTADDVSEPATEAQEFAPEADFEAVRDDETIDDADADEIAERAAEDAAEDSAEDAETDVAGPDALAAFGDEVAELPDDTDAEVVDDLVADAAGPVIPDDVDDTDMAADEPDGDEVAAAQADAPVRDSDSDDIENVFDDTEDDTEDAIVAGPADEDIDDDFDDDHDDMRLFDEDIDENDAETGEEPDLDSLNAILEATADKPDENPDDATADAEPRSKVRVVKMTRAEFEQAFASDDVAEADDPEAAQDLPAEPDTAKAAAEDVAADETPDGTTDKSRIRETLGETGLSSEAEDDLISELADLERDIDGSAAVETEAAESEAAEDTRSETPGDPADSTTAETRSEDLSVDRLLAQANNELQTDESSRRRSAISHLKAAVAAVRADGGRADKAAAAEEARALNQYRDDLAQVVRPEPQAAAPAPQERERHRRRMPPLMLVSEQRVDRPAPTEDSAPVRPRRVSASDLDEHSAGDETGETADAGDFGAFVAETGAKSVPELLEASTAFGTYVEGQPFNSRPQIMARVMHHLPDGALGREEALRAFGVLLREGRIHRINRGEFALPDGNRFEDVRRSVAG